MKTNLTRSARRRQGIAGLIIAAILAFPLIVWVASGGRPSDLFRKLPQGQTVQIVFTSQGCFHHTVYEFEFKRAPELTATIVEVQENWNPSTKTMVVTKRIPLGTVKITDEEAAGLDKLIDFYRNPKDGWSTTHDGISITIRDANKVIEKRKYDDESSRSYEVEGLVLFSDLVDKLSGKPKHAVQKPIEQVLAEEKAKAIELCKGLPGYERFEKSFKITNATVGNVNMMPESLFVEIKATHSALVDSAWWWNPLKNGKPTLNWDDFMKAHAEAETAMAAHPWLKDWKRLPGKRALELQLLGREFGERKQELNDSVIPVWRHAGFKGEPKYAFIARRGNHEWVTIYFGGKDEAKALVPSSTGSGSKASCPLDNVEVSWHPRGKAGEEYSRYAVVENDGRCHVETFVAGNGKQSD